MYGASFDPVSPSEPSSIISTEHNGYLMRTTFELQFDELVAVSTYLCVSLAMRPQQQSFIMSSARYLLCSIPRPG